MKHKLLVKHKIENQVLWSSNLKRNKFNFIPNFGSMREETTKALAEQNLRDVISLFNQSSLETRNLSNKLIE